MMGRSGLLGSTWTDSRHLVSFTSLLAAPSHQCNRLRARGGVYSSTLIETASVLAQPYCVVVQHLELQELGHT